MHTTIRQKIWVLAVAALLAAAITPAQEPRKWNFRAVNYDLNATLLPMDQTLLARVKVDFEALEASRQLDVELHPNLKVEKVTTADGKPVPFDRDPEVALRLRVTLPEALAVGKRVTVTFEYTGILANEENSPVKDTRVAYIGQDACYLLLPARWFPLTDFPANRYTGVFKITVPENVSVAGTGKVTGPTAALPVPPAPTKQGEGPARSAPARVVYTFQVEQPESAGSFVAGNLRVMPVTAEGMTIPVYVAAEGVENAAQYAQTAAAIFDFFSDTFGALPQPQLAIGQLPEGSLAGYSAPGLVLIGKRQWTQQVNHRLLARLVAAQWWGNGVQVASPNDAWLTDGLARYSEALFVQHQAGEEGFNKALEDFAVGALAYEDAAPIAQAGRLVPYSSEYTSVVVNKGALVFHMLRSHLGKDAFTALLQEFHRKFAGKSAKIDDFQKLAQTFTEGPQAADKPTFNLGPFFVNWLNSTGVPEFKLEYVVVRTQKGFRVSGKVKQELETFRMPVDVKVLTDGNPVTSTIDVVGTESDFNIETFGRPKPGGITLDPNNNVLKSSPRLRVRAAIARGEEMAEQGKFFDAIQEYQRAIELQKNSSLASFRMGEAFFYQKNYQAAANAFRDALDGDLDLSYKWVEVWSHLYIGKIFDLSGQRERAINEYTKAQQTNDNTGGAQAEIEKLLKEPFKG